MHPDGHCSVLLVVLGGSFINYHLFSNFSTTAFISVIIKVADLSPEIAVESTVMRGFHSDPADQIIVATSRILGLRLVTSDKQILKFSEVDTIW
jgi:PIN domain nuclease of toxin-antitoxin system